MANTMTLIASSTVPSGGAASIDFNSIPSTYTDLVLKYSTRCTAGANVGIVLSLNGSTVNFTDKYLEGSGSAATSGSNARSGSYIAVSGDGATSTPNNGELYIPNYAGSTNKSFSVDAVAENNGTLAYSDLVAGLWSNTAAINQVTIACTSGNFSQFSTAYLYGIKNS
jgi:hypothetical protein